MAAAAAAVAQLAMGKAVRDGFFLANFDADALPQMMIVAAVVSFASVVGMSRAMTRFTPWRVMPVLFGVAAVLFVGHAMLSQVAPRASAVALYLHMAFFGSTAVSGFWSLVNERYDPHTAKRVVSRLAGGATVGGILGALLAWQAATRLPVSLLMYLMGALNLLCVAGVLGMGAGPSPAAVNPTLEPRPLVSGLETLRSAPYLRHLAWLVVLTSVASALMDYFLGVRAKAMYATSSDLLSFYALYQLGIGVLSFVLLTVASRPALKALGLAATVALLPATVVLGGAMALVLPGIASGLAMRCADAVLRNSLFRSAYELLFTPVEAERKRATKLIIDVGFDRVGTAVGSGLALLVVFVATAHTERVIAAMVVGLSFASLWVAARLHEGYLRALEESLRAGVVKLDVSEVVDAATWRTVTQTNLQLDRRKILEEIARLRERSTGSIPPGPPVAHAVCDDPVLQAIADLRSRDVDRVRRVLSSDSPIDLVCVAHVIPLLGDDALHADALRVLQKVAPRACGQLVDALMDADAPMMVRRRLPSVLQRLSSQRAVDGLVAGLSDRRFEVRYRCGVALWMMTEREPALQVDRIAVLDAVRREVDVERDVWEAQAQVDVRASQEDSVLEDLLAERKSRSLQHVFRVLSLTIEREPLMLALRALEGDDPRLRGTSLEYLENILPDDIRRKLWPFLGVPRERVSTPRPRSEVMQELLASGVEMSVESLRRSLDRDVK